MRRDARCFKTIEGNDVVLSWVYGDNNTNIFTFRDIETGMTFSCNGENALSMVSFIAKNVSEFIEE